jgi:bacterioferritin B
MVSQPMNAKLNAQITNEFNASQTYLAMACLFDDLGFQALSKYFREHADEERGHALKIVDYMLDTDSRVALQPIPAPPANYNGVVAAIEAALNHERMVTQNFHDLMELARQEHDFTTEFFLKWFVDEQVEEEKTFTDLLNAARAAKDHLLELDLYVKEVVMEKG